MTILHNLCLDSIYPSEVLIKKVQTQQSRRLKFHVQDSLNRSCIIIFIIIYLINFCKVSIF